MSNDHPTLALTDLLRAVVILPSTDGKLSYSAKSTSRLEIDQSEGNLSITGPGVLASPTLVVLAPPETHLVIQRCRSVNSSTPLAHVGAFLTNRDRLKLGRVRQVYAQLAKQASITIDELDGPGEIGLQDNEAEATINGLEYRGRGLLVGKGSARGFQIIDPTVNPVQELDHTPARPIGLDL